MRPYLFERVDDVAVVHVHADGFASLAVRNKLYYDQRYAHNLVS